MEGVSERLVVCGTHLVKITEADAQHVVVQVWACGGWRGGTEMPREFVDRRLAEIEHDDAPEFSGNTT